MLFLDNTLFNYYSENTILTKSFASITMKNDKMILEPLFSNNRFVSKYCVKIIADNLMHVNEKLMVKKWVLFALHTLLIIFIQNDPDILIIK